MLEQQIQLPNPYGNQFKSASGLNIRPRNNMLTIEDKSLASSILNALGDPQKLSILKTITKKPMITSEILDECKIANTSGYRKINSLIQDGLLVKNDLVVTEDGRRIVRYRPLFENFEIDISRDKITVKAQLL